MIGGGSDRQRQIGASIGSGNDVVGSIVDVSCYLTDGYRDHSAAQRTQMAGKILLRPSSATTLTATINHFDQPDAQAPSGLVRADFIRNSRQVIPAAVTFNIRKSIDQQQAGLLINHKVSANDTLNARLYSGRRDVEQFLAFSGGAPTSAGGVIDLDSEYGSIGMNWSHTMRIQDLPFRWVIGLDADNLQERRRSFVNNNGVADELRRDEMDRAPNLDIFGQADWRFASQW